MWNTQIVELANAKWTCTGTRVYAECQCRDGRSEDKSNGRDTMNFRNERSLRGNAEDLVW